MADPKDLQTKTCPDCGAVVPEAAKQCPACGHPFPASDTKWYQNLTPTEIFLLVLGSIMLAIGLVAI